MARRDPRLPPRRGYYQDFVIGNVLDVLFEEALASPVYERVRRDVHASLALCAQSCTYFDLCGGAFLSNTFWQSGTLLSTETVTCRLTRQAVADILSVAGPTV